MPIKHEVTDEEKHRNELKAESGKLKVKRKTEHMSVETRKEIWDGVKGFTWIALVVIGWLIVDKLQIIDRKLERLEQIESRLIRVEYELKLK